jgi:HD-like signal output (HDOD) protein
VFASFEKAPSRSFSLEHFQMYSLRAARLARRLMHALDPRLEEEAYTAAIVHDIGKLVLALRHPAELEVVQQRIVQQGESARQAELAVLGVSHAEIGAHLLATWGIPFNVVESTAFHDHPSDVKGKPGEVLVVTHFADAASGILTCGDPETKIDNDLLVRAGVAEQRAKWMATCKEEVSTWA